VRRPLLWLGVADPLETQGLVRSADPVREALLGLLHAWQGAFGSESHTVARAVETANAPGQSANPQLLEALQSVAGERNGVINGRRLGRYLVRNARRIEDGMRIEIMGKDPVTKCQRFRVAGVSGVSGVSSNPTREIGNSVDKRETNTGNPGNHGTPCRQCAGEGCAWCQSSVERTDARSRLV
jgi:hypothetical protein